MENATKALLIAAAVLVAVLIISLGIVVYTKASEAVEGAGNLSEYQIQQFNEKFYKYQGENKSGSEVNALLQTVLNHNNTQDTDDTCVEVKFDNGYDHDGIEAKNSITSIPEKVNTGSRFKVVCTIDSNSKLINKITVTLKNSSGSGSGSGGSGSGSDSGSGSGS